MSDSHRERKMCARVYTHTHTHIRERIVCNRQIHLNLSFAVGYPPSSRFSIKWHSDTSIFTCIYYFDRVEIHNRTDIFGVPPVIGNTRCTVRPTGKLSGVNFSMLDEISACELKGYYIGNTDALIRIQQLLVCKIYVKLID